MKFAHFFLSYMQEKFTHIEGLAVKIIPQNFLLKPNETMKFQVEVMAQKEGTYYSSCPRR